MDRAVDPARRRGQRRGEEGQDQAGGDAPGRSRTSASRARRVAAPTAAGAISSRAKGFCSPPVRPSSSESWTRSKPSWTTASRLPDSRAVGQARLADRLAKAEAAMTPRQGTSGSE